jgi:L-alanine-DL-glutamate epimerase-like enolase superfamily enzyme
VQVAPHLYAGPVAWAAAIQLAASIPNFLILETVDTPFHAALIGAAIAVEDGHVRVPDAPGLGIAFDEALALANPWTGDRLHLEMQQSPPGVRDDRFAGG